MALTDIAIKAIKKPDSSKKLSDGGGLFLLVTTSGSKHWRMAYRFEGKQKTLAFGSYPAVTLADARKRREEAKALLAKQVDPSQHAKLEKIAKRHSNAMTFKAVADEFLQKVAKEGKAKTTQAKKEWLLSLAMNDLGARPVAEISAAEILVPLLRVQEKGNYETARRMRSAIGQVFRFAIATARAENDPTFGLKGALTNRFGLPAGNRGPQGDSAIGLAGAGSASTVERLEKLASLRASGALDETEFNKMKAELLAQQGR